LNSLPLTNEFIKLFEGENQSAYQAIDLSKFNRDLLKLDLSEPANIQRYIKGILAEKNKNIAYGGYLEERNLYNHSAIFSADKTQRNIHLGVDFWLDEQTPILTPFTGKVHSFANNDNPGDYGPTIILEHSINQEKIYSLYGHLTLQSIDHLKVGRVFKKGEVLGALGDADVNGGYAPHLHFQMIRDIQHYIGDYPGVAAKNELKFYSDNCPNPLHYLGFDY
jgi:murein DD-endopeptidase MepM/ murein hydrolase activator NlpD